MDSIQSLLQFFFLISPIHLRSIWSASIKFDFNAEIKTNASVFVSRDEYPFNKNMKRL